MDCQKFNKMQDKDHPMVLELNGTEQARVIQAQRIVLEAKEVQLMNMSYHVTGLEDKLAQLEGGSMRKQIVTEHQGSSSTWEDVQIQQRDKNPGRLKPTCFNYREVGHKSFQCPKKGLRKMQEPVEDLAPPK